MPKTKIALWKFVLKFLVTSIPGVTGAWSSEGCRRAKVQRYEGYVICECNHLTNFALLLDVSQKDTFVNTKELLIVTLIGCGMSLAGLGITVAVYWYFRWVFALKGVILLYLLHHLCWKIYYGIYHSSGNSS